jgi:L-histidine Nalpha-methyltransferase
MSSLREDVLVGLTSEPKELPPKWFYDTRGSELFDQITRLPEYYPTRCERAILAAEADVIAAASAADTLIELGSGTSEKTRLLLATGQFRRYVPFDVSKETLHTACDSIRSEFPSLVVEPVVGDFDHDLDRLPRDGRRVVAFLGGTIGNFQPAERKQFLADVSAQLDPGDSFLLGTDLVKDIARLEAAYDDAAGVTAEFNKNVLRVINRELHADFDLDRFEHRAFFDTDKEWIEMRLVSIGRQQVHIHDLDLVVEFADGEEMRTEISAKFRRDGVEAELAGAGLRLAEWWTDPDTEFALSLSFA